MLLDGTLRWLGLMVVYSKKNKWWQQVLTHPNRFWANGFRQNRGMPWMRCNLSRSKTENRGHDPPTWTWKLRRWEFLPSRNTWWHMDVICTVYKELLRCKEDHMVAKVHFVNEHGDDLPAFSEGRWWFGTCCFSIQLGIIMPTAYYFSEGLKPPTRYECWSGCGWSMRTTGRSRVSHDGRFTNRWTHPKISSFQIGKLNIETFDIFGYTGGFGIKEAAEVSLGIKKWELSPVSSMAMRSS